MIMSNVYRIVQFHFNLLNNLFQLMMWGILSDQQFVNDKFIFIFLVSNICKLILHFILLRFKFPHLFLSSELNGISSILAIGCYLSYFQTFFFLTNLTAALRMLKISKICLKWIEVWSLPFCIQNPINFWQKCWFN